MDNIKVNHTDYDIKNNQIPIVQVTQSQRWIEYTINEINKWIKWVKLELPKTKEQQEKEVLELVLNWEHWKDIKNDYPWWITLKFIDKYTFAFINKLTWNVNYFVNSKWEILFGLWNLRERPFLKNWKALEYAWYIEKKEDWIYNMYKIEWWKEIWPIDINSPEYYNAWQDIIFYADFLNKTVSLKFNDPETKKWIEVLIEWWSFKFEDLELFKDEWLITQEIFDYWLQEMQKVIVAQCSDERLINMKLNKEQFRKKDWSLPKWLEKLSIWGVKESDLMKYYSKWYIDKDTAVECYKAMPSEMRDVTNKKD